LLQALSKSDYDAIPELKKRYVAIQSEVKENKAARINTASLSLEELIMKNSAKDQTDFPQRMFDLGDEFNAKFGDIWSMVGPVSVERDDDFHSNSPYAIGAKRSFVPVLGEIVWELPKKTAVRVPFSAYICRGGDGQHIGYVRIPNYAYNKRVVEEFAKLITRFESDTVAMVLDQVNNGGGSISHMYALLSYLTDKPLALPMHQLTINEDDIAIAREMVTIAESGDAVASEEKLSPNLIFYYRFLLSEFQAGRGTSHRLTNPVYLLGVDEVLPAKNHYSKKIVVLINELDFSAAEFLAAILQDNKRATLFGERTAGAGGCVRTIKTPNKFGVECISLTWTIAWRTNGQPIQNIGVYPDNRYSVTVEDLQAGFSGYRQALLASI
jgi:hypothetical protein